MNRFWQTSIAMALVPALGCIVYQRDPEHLEEETVELVETGKDSIQACYDAYLVDAQMNIEKAERAAQGEYEDIGPAVSSAIKNEKGLVVVNFQVTAKTGAIENPVVVKEHTTAPAPLVDCVLATLEGLAIDPPDSRTGSVTYAWKFRVGKRGKDRPEKMGNAFAPGSDARPEGSWDKPEDEGAAPAEGTSPSSSTPADPPAEGPASDEAAASSPPAEPKE